jgi:hypothetical protein
MLHAGGMALIVFLFFLFFPFNHLQQNVKSQRVVLQPHFDMNHVSHKLSARLFVYKRDSSKSAHLFFFKKKKKDPET